MKSTIKLLKTNLLKVAIKAFALMLTLLSIAVLSSSGQTVTMSFPGGFDNCTNPLPNAGNYSVTGIVNGKNEYTKPGGNPRIRWTGARWEWQADDPTISGINFITCWYNNNNTTACPADCWQSSFGCFIPIFTGAVTPAATINSINRVGFNLANAGSVNFAVTFSNLITGLTASNFTTVNTGTVSSTITLVAQGAGNTWTVAVSTTGDGTVGLNMINGTGTGAVFCSSFPFTGQTYTINNTVAPVTLSVGDIAFTGYNSSSTTVDDFSFVVLRTGGIPIGTKIYFTDDGYGSIESGLRPGEGLMLWTATAAVAQFSQVTINSNLSPVSYSVTSGTATAILSNINLSNSGDQLFAYQGTMGSPTFITGIHMNAETGVGSTNASSSLTGWDNFTTGSAPFTIGSGTSAIPPSLINGTNAVMPVNNANSPYLEFDNAVYNCTGATLATTVTAMRASINDRDNWTKQDAATYTVPPSCTFSVVPSCVNPTVPTLSASSLTNCGTQSTTLSIASGTLNNATAWKWYSGSCGGTLVGTGASISVSPVTSTTYFARGEGGCITPGACGNITVTVNTPQNWYLDADNDGHFVTGPVSACSSPGAGYNTTSTLSGDCNDNNNALWQNLSGYVDADGDGYTVGSLISVCSGAALPAGYSSTSAGTDCDDNNNMVYQNLTAYVDADGDGYTVGSAISLCTGVTLPSGYSATSLGTDCDDSNASIHPGATEIYCNGIDENCNGMGDDGVQSTDPISAASDAQFDEICLGNSTNLTVNGGSLGTNADWKWHVGSCNGTVAATGTTVSVSPTATTTYFVRAEGPCGNTNCVIITIKVSTVPVTSLALLPFTGMPANLCNGTTATLSVAPVNKATYYTWDAPAGAYFNGNPLNVSPFLTISPSVTLTVANPSGSLYNIGIQAGNACGSSLRQAQKVRGVLSVPASVSGVVTACANAIETYSTPVVTGASSYLWTITGDASVSGTGSNVTVTFGPSWAGGTLCVAAQTTCYTSASKCLTINSSSATLGAISGTFTACPNSTLAYSVPASTGAASYAWTVPSGASITSGSGTNSVGVNFAAGFNAVGNICVSVTSICGITSAPKCKSIAPGLPQQPSSITGPCNGLCGQTVVYSCPSQGAGVSYNWTVPASATINSGQGGTAISVTYSTFATGPLTVTASNACGNSIVRNLTVKGAPNSPGAITATPSSWCANTSGVEFNVSVGSLTGTYALSWLFPSAPVATYVLGGGNSTNLIMDWGTGSGTINVMASNACGSGTRTSTWSSTCRQGEIEVQNNISLSPNPTTGLINISYSSTKGNGQVRVLDLSGRVVVVQNTTMVDGNNNTQLDLSNLAKGAYMVSMETSQWNKQIKVVLE